MRRIYYGICFVILFLLHTVPLTNAGECRYGSLHAWFRTPDGNWTNATAHPQLKRGEKFDIKIILTAKCDLQSVFFKLHEFGTPVYEVINGSVAIDDILACGYMVKMNQTFTYLWTLQVRPNTTWTNAYAPLEVFAQFKRDDHDSCKVSFDVITAYILDTVWEEYHHQNNNTDNLVENTDTIPGFEIGIFNMGLFLIIFLFRKNRYQS